LTCLLSVVTTAVCAKKTLYYTNRSLPSESTYAVMGLLKGAGSRRRKQGLRLVGLCLTSSLSFDRFNKWLNSDELPTFSRKSLFSRTLHDRTPKSTFKLPIYFSDHYIFSRW